MPPMRGALRPFSILAPLTLVFVASPVFAADYYVAPNGSDANPGSTDRPFATLQRGHDAASAGDTVWIRGGTYSITTPENSGAGIALTKSGSSDANRIKFWAEPGE